MTGDTDAEKYERALSWQQYRNSPDAVKKIWWTPKHHVYVTRDGSEYNFKHDYMAHPCIEVKK